MGAFDGVKNSQLIDYEPDRLTTVPWYLYSSIVRM